MRDHNSVDMLLSMLYEWTKFVNSIIVILFIMIYLSSV